VSAREDREQARAARDRARYEKASARSRENARPRTIEELRRECHDLGTRIGWWARRNQREDIDSLGSFVESLGRDLSEDRDVDWVDIIKFAQCLKRGEGHSRVASERWGRALARERRIRRQSPKVIDIASARAKREVRP
jgi:hypothetical protein